MDAHKILLKWRYRLKTIIGITAFLVPFLTVNNVAARDDHHMFSIEEAINSPAAKEKHNPNIKLYFGNQGHPKIAKDFGEWKTNKKTNGLGKSDKQACEWVFITALLQMQEKAQQQGANAVVRIKSNYKSIERSSTTEYMCGSGALMSGVALKGEVVKLVR